MECRASKRALMNGPPGPLPTHHLSFIGEILRSASCKPKTLSTGKLRFHQRRYFSHVGAPRELAFQCPHDFAHVGRASSACLRSEEHTSELQSPCNLVCRLLLEKKNERTIL